MTHYLYKIAVGGKVYIGTAINPSKRWREHSRAKSPVGHAIRKYGLDKTTFKVIGQRRTAKAIHALERAAIVRLRTRAPHGYNISKSGNGCPHTPKWYRAIKRRSANPKYRAHVASANRRTARTVKWRAVHTAALKRTAGDPKWLAATRAGSKRQSTPMWRANCAVTNRRITRTQTWRAAHTAAMMRLARTPKWRRAQKAGAKRGWLRRKQNR